MDKNLVAFSLLCLGLSTLRANHGDLPKNPGADSEPRGEKQDEASQGAGDGAASSADNTEKTLREGVGADT